MAGQRHASPHTVAAYRDAWRLVLRFVRERTGKEPCQLDLADLDATVIGAFLDHLEQKRHNSARTRNARLAAIRSFFHYAAFRHPEHAGLIAPGARHPHQTLPAHRGLLPDPTRARSPRGSPRPRHLDRAA
ncbi:MAG: site-specific integrase [Actinomycetota bacterium]|nr:site-specific integrase [Actinomycetota bacterium]